MIRRSNSGFQDTIGWRVSTLLLFVGAMWFVHAIDELLPKGFSAVGLGIVPRTYDGLGGIFLAPFIHASWQHLIANSIPLLILGGLVLVGGVGEFLYVVFFTAMVSGIGTWCFGESGTQHVGASGVALGLLGYLLFRAAFDRKILSLIVSLAVALTYATVLASSLMPREHVSWSGHFFGFVGGFLAARLRYPTAPKPADPRVARALSLLESSRRDE